MIMELNKVLGYIWYQLAGNNYFYVEIASGSRLVIVISRQIAITRRLAAVILHSNRCY